MADEWPCEATLEHWRTATDEQLASVVLPQVCVVSLWNRSMMLACTVVRSRIRKRWSALTPAVGSAAAARVQTLMDRTAALALALAVAAPLQMFGFNALEPE